MRLRRSVCNISEFMRQLTILHVPSHDVLLYLRKKLARNEVFLLHVVQMVLFM